MPLLTLRRPLGKILVGICRSHEAIFLPRPLLGEQTFVSAESMGELKISKQLPNSTDSGAIWSALTLRHLNEGAAGSRMAHGKQDVSLAGDTVSF
jgi:hypothetical protein